MSEFPVENYPFIRTLETGAINSDGVPPSYGPDGKISYEAFLEWADEDTHAEWVNGAIEMTSPASYKHQDIVSFLDNILRPFVEAYDLGKVLTAGYQMKLPAGGPGREPDVLFIAKPHLHRIQSTYLNGPADTVIEMVSPGKYHQERDRKAKFGEYAKGGVSEYWLIDPERQQAEFYWLDQSGQYQPTQPDTEGKVFSKVITDFWLKVEWLWQQPLPEVGAILLKVGGARYASYMIEQLKSHGYL